MSTYLQRMRQYVGHQPIYICGAGVIVENAAGEILLQLRTDNHCWGINGGCVELDEPVEDAARRELWEETGLTGGALELLGIFSGPDQHYIYPNGDEVSVVHIVYTCKEYTGTLTAQPDEVGDLRFFDIRHLPDNISPPCIPVIDRYITMRKG